MKTLRIITFVENLIPLQQLSFGYNQTFTFLKVFAYQDVKSILTMLIIVTEVFTIQSTQRVSERWVKLDCCWIFLKRQIVTFYSIGSKDQ